MAWDDRLPARPLAAPLGAWEVSEWAPGRYAYRSVEIHGYLTNGAGDENPLFRWTPWIAVEDDQESREDRKRHAERCAQDAAQQTVDELDVRRHVPAIVTRGNVVQGSVLR